MEQLARKWVERCKFEHPDHSQHPEYQGTGQNLAQSNGKEFTMTDYAKMWFSENVNYTYANNSCKGPACGHYTQVLI